MKNDIHMNTTQISVFQSILDKKFMQKIINLSGKIYFVGGCVRDYILNVEPKDIDIVIAGFEYDFLVNLLKDFGRVDVVGKSFGVIKFKEFETKFEIEIALPRTDVKDHTAKGHTSIIAQSDPFLPIEKDLLRRDFTINSIALDHNLNFIDPFGGLKDIENKLIKATNIDAFKDDPLRMLRAIQFSARFDFFVDIETGLLIFDQAKHIKEITAERILMEFEKVFSKKVNIDKFKSNLIFSGLFKYIFGFTPPIQFLENILSNKIELSEFLFDCCKNSMEYSDISDFLIKKFKIDIQTTKKIKALSYFYSSPAFLFEDKYPLNKLLFEVLQIFPKAYELEKLKNFYKQYLIADYPKSYNDLALTGNDIIQHLNLPEGPQIGVIRKQLMDKILKNEINNTFEDCLKEALKY